MSSVLSSGGDFDVDELEYELKVTGSLTFEWEVMLLISAKLSQPCL